MVGMTISAFARWCLWCPPVPTGVFRLAPVSARHSEMSRFESTAAAIDSSSVATAIPVATTLARPEEPLTRRWLVGGVLRCMELLVQ
jgi:hypothetical protein